MRIAAEGVPFIVGLGLIAAILFAVGHSAAYGMGGVSFVLAIFCCFFFRDPLRNPDPDPRFVISPGHGRIMEVTEETHAMTGGKVKVIRIFLSILDVHVQHSPISGKVARIEYQKGKFLDARHPKAAHENENNSILIENDRMKVVVKQIAGLIARRIVCHVRLGEEVRVGQKLGLIRFGSQVDVYLPTDLEVCVAPGERVVSGVSLLAIKK